MRLRSTWRHAVTLLLLVEAGVLHSRRPVSLGTEAWVPLVMPMPLQKGTIVTPEFEAGQDITYFLFVAGHRTMEEIRIQCLLGMVDSRRNLLCGDDRETVDVAWTLLRKGEVLATGATGTLRRGLLGDVVAREIGHFEARKGERYTVAIEVRRDGGELNQTDPEFRVQTYPSAWKDAAIQAFGDRMLRRIGIGACLVLSLLLWIVPPAIRWVRGRLAVRDGKP